MDQAAATTRSALRRWLGLYYAYDSVSRVLGLRHLVGAVFLHEAIGLVRPCEFWFESLCVFSADANRKTRYRQSEHVFLLLGVRAEPTFAGRGLRGYVKCDDDHRRLRRENIVELIERVSTGANLELFGNYCSGRDEWKCCEGA